MMFRHGPYSFLYFTEPLGKNVANDAETFEATGCHTDKHLVGERCQNCHAAIKEIAIDIIGRGFRNPQDLFNAGLLRQRRDAHQLTLASKVCVALEIPVFREIALMLAACKPFQNSACVAAASILSRVARSLLDISPEDESGSG
ncbi:hypothetical protein AB9E06_21920 [Rhizobium leguminosarum]|uniref:hypothetical protein n=1 Tax=Rhizobium leguminosarum TaxID=384 RepID=UPI003F9D1148